MYAALREHDPVHRVVPENDPAADYWVLTRHRNVYDAARDVETFSSAGGLTTEYDELDKIGLRDNPPLVMQDPPVHTEFRRTVSRGFTPRQVSSVEPAVRAFVVERLARLAEAGGGDIVAELFKPLPTMVVAHYLGVPEEDRDRFDGWTDAIVAASSAGHPYDAAEAAGELMTYFTELAERRKKEPGDDTISHLVAAGMADDMGGLLSILGFAFTMVTGGNDTTTGMLGGAVQLLTQPARPARDARGRSQPHPGRRRGTAAAHVTGARPRSHDDSGRRRRRHHHPGGSQGAAALRRRQPRRRGIRLRTPTSSMSPAGRSTS